jgi:hypothetical protein
LRDGIDPPAINVIPVQLFTRPPNRYTHPTLRRKSDAFPMGLLDPEVDPLQLQRNGSPKFARRDKPTSR